MNRTAPATNERRPDLNSIHEPQPATHEENMKSAPRPTTARAKQLRDGRKKEEAEARALEEAKLRARNLEILMGIDEGDRPLWPECSMDLRVGAIRPIRTIDSILERLGLQGSLVASMSSYVLDIPNHGQFGTHLDPQAHVEFIAGSTNGVFGLRDQATGKWMFIVTLTAEDMSRLRSFAAAVDIDGTIWSSPEATVRFRSGRLRQLPVDGYDPVSFYAAIDSLEIGSVAADDS